MAPRAHHRSLLHPLAAALATFAASAACTLLVDSKLDGRTTTVADAGPCEEIAFDDGSLLDGGAAVYFHSGVGAVAFHSRAWWVEGDNNPSTAALAFASDAGVVAVNCDDSRGRPGFRIAGDLASVAQLYVPAGHGRLGSACYEVLTGTVDALRDTTLFALWTGGCVDPEASVDAGAVTPRTKALDTGIGWSALDGGVLGLHIGGDGILCGEGQGPASCSAGEAGLSPGRGPRQLHGFASADGTALVWAQTSGSNGLSLRSARLNLRSHAVNRRSRSPNSRSDGLNLRSGSFNLWRHAFDLRSASLNLRSHGLNSRSGSLNLRRHSVNLRSGSANLRSRFFNLRSRGTG